MNPNLQHLEPYPFTKLRQLFDGLAPAADKAPIALSIGEPQHASPGGALPASGFADEREGFPFLDREAHIVNGLDDGFLTEQSATASEVLHEATNFNQRHQERTPSGVGPPSLGRPSAELRRGRAEEACGREGGES